MTCGASIAAAIQHGRAANEFTGAIDAYEEADDFDPERLASCAYWRCQELFETRHVNHRFCRKACRSRQRKWERAERRRALREQRRT